MSRSLSAFFIHAAKAARHAVIGSYASLRISIASSSVDYLLVSYPKSGRTWFRYILACYFSDSLGLPSAPDLSEMFRLLPNLDWDSERGLPAYRNGPAAAAKLPLIAVTHHRPDVRQLPSAPIIFMLRDPRDVLVSRYYHATRHKHEFSGDISAFIRDTDQGLPAWVKHTNDWAAVLANRRKVIVSYERLSTSPADEIGYVLAFLGQPVDADRLARAIAAAEIDRMRELEVQNGIPGHRYDRNDPQALRIRRGIVGGYQDELNGNDLEWIDQFNAAHLGRAAKELVENVIRRNVSGTRADPLLSDGLETGVFPDQPSGNGSILGAREIMRLG